MSEKTLVDMLDEHRTEAEAFLRKSEYPSYDAMVGFLAEMHPDMDHERVTRIDHGHYQGTLVFVVGGEGYQPYRHWYVKVGYGSCSGCDALESARDECSWDYDTNQRDNVAPLYKLLHDLASSMREMNEGGDKVA